MLPLSALNRQFQAQPNPEPGSSHKKQTRFSFQSQYPASPAPTEPPKPSLSNPTQPSQQIQSAQPSPKTLQKHFAENFFLQNPSKPLKTLHLQNVSAKTSSALSPSPQATAPSPQPGSPSPQAGPNSKCGSKTRNLSKTFLRKPSPKTSWHPNP